MADALTKVKSHCDLTKAPTREKIEHLLSSGLFESIRRIDG